jgi:MFS transporter, DHA2 family, multidrug resistance protein
MGHYLAVREQLHSNLLGLHVQSGNWLDDTSIHQLSAGLFGKSSGLTAATGRAVGVVAGRVRLQAYSLASIDGFHLIAWACVGALVLVALLRRAPLNYGELGLPDEGPSGPERKKS